MANFNSKLLVYQRVYRRYIHFIQVGFSRGWDPGPKRKASNDGPVFSPKVGHDGQQLGTHPFTLGKSMGNSQEYHGNMGFSMGFSMGIVGYLMGI
jgi:hypothetical protein